MAAGATDPMTFRTIVIVGGGCYGSYYVRQLRRARAAGKAAWERIAVVDRDASCPVARDRLAQADLAAGSWEGVEIAVSDWADFFSVYLETAASAPEEQARDAIVPSPLMPHLLFEWLVARARARWPRAGITAEVPGELAGVPWQKAGLGGTRYASYATWICPINCIEPRKCPHTGSPRDWSFHESLVAGPRAEGTALLRVTHRLHGVGMIDVADVVAADALVAAELARLGTVNVATASHCHGAVAGMRRAVTVSPASPPDEISGMPARFSRGPS